MRFSTRLGSLRLSLAFVVLLAGCGLADVDATPRTTSDAAPTLNPPSNEPSSPPTDGNIVPAPGSTSALYAPNPSAITVAIDAGHGGCLDWGVPDPSERGVELAEKSLTLGIARHLRDRLTADGVEVVMIRDADNALAGDDYPPLGCDGPPWRDVNGDGVVGFGPDVPEATRTRDELQARLDLANVARADALISIHINSPSEGGARIEIAFTETFYTDETPWGAEQTAKLAQGVQDGVVSRLAPLAGYERGDRGITAHNLYIVAPPLFEPTPDRPDPAKQPTRGGLMPVVLAEVGSITLRAEHDLLASDAGQEGVAQGLMDGLAAYLAQRSLAASIGLADDTARTPTAVDGEGPMFWVDSIDEDIVGLRLTNSGSEPWPPGLELMVGWEETDQPYLASPPAELAPLPVEVPALAPGEAVTLQVHLAHESQGRAVAWISLRDGSTTTADLGSPALQLSSEAP